MRIPFGPGALLGVLGLVTLALIARFHFPAQRTLIGETCAFLALGLLLARHPAVRHAVTSLPPGFRVLVVLLPAALVAGHVVNRADRAFPLVTWDLYTQAMSGDPAYHEWIVVRGDADTGAAALAERTLFPSLRRRITVALETATAQALHAAPGRERAVARMQTLMAALAREHERRYPGPPIRAIDVWHRTVPIEHYQGRSSIPRRHERRVEVR